MTSQLSQEEAYIARHYARIGFTGTPAKQDTPPEPRRVPLGFAPGQTTDQINIAR